MSYQLPLFELEEQLSHDPIQLLRDGAALVLSISGGKDSDAMCHHLLERRQFEGWSGDVAMVYADLGRAEWHNTTDIRTRFGTAQKYSLTYCSLDTGRSD